MEREVISVKEAAQRLGLSRVTVWRLLRDQDKHLDGYQKTPFPGSPWVVYVDSVDEYIKKRGGSE